jgi:cytochrome P450
VDFDLHEQRSGMTPVHEWWLELRGRTESPLVWTPRNGGHWIALQPDHILEILSDSDHFSSRSVQVPRGDREGVRGFIPVTLDPPQHGAYRAILNPLLAPQPVRAQEEVVRGIARALAVELKNKGSCEFMGEFARKIPSAVILSMANLPLADCELLVDLNESLVRPQGSRDHDTALKQFEDYFRPVIERRRGGSGSDAITAIANGRVDGQLVNDEDAVGLVKQFIGAGLDSTASMMGFMILFLARNPSDRRLLSENSKFMAAGVREMLRRFAFVSLGRIVRKDRVFHGFELRAEDVILAPTALVSSDTGMFSRSLAADISRPHGPQGTFGDGRHRCPGAGLARTELSIAVEAWLDHIPDFDIDAESLTFKNGLVPSLAALPLRWRV